MNISVLQKCYIGIPSSRKVILLMNGTYQNYIS